MAFMEWSDQYLLGIPDVDEQHQRLFALVSRLHENVVSGEAQSAAGGILDELIEYTVEHFATEEKRFLAESYPLFDEHKKEHDRLTRQALELQEKFRANQITVTFDLLDFLSDWLKTHTTDSDLKYAQFARGKKGEAL